MDVHFLDTTFRDGHQSLWAMGMRHGMMEAVAGDMDRVGFDVIEIPGNGIHFKKMIRDLKEDPWETMAMFAKKMPNTPKSCMGSTFNLNFFGPSSPPELGKLFWSLLVEMGALQRLQLMSNTADQLERDFPTLFPFMKKIGMKTAAAICFSISPRHTDALFAEKTRRAAAFDPDVIYIKDAAGLLTVDRIRTLIPAIREQTGGIPLELHSHCTTGLAPLVYMEALHLGVRTLHTGIPPLAEGSAQPSVLHIARNARLLGYEPRVDEELLQSIAQRLKEIARQDNLPVGETMPFDQGQYVHQIPGGVISNLRFQLADLRMEDRLDEVVQETVQIRKELGFPIMITPFSQFMCTQAALNVATGERYRMVADELIRFAQGVYGEDSGHPWMDQELKDKLLSNPRAKDLAALTHVPVEDISVNEVRKRMGLEGVSDEELLSQVIMKGDREIKAMRAAGPPKQYLGAMTPLRTLLEELGKDKSLRHFQLQWDNGSLTLQA